MPGDGDGYAPAHSKPQLLVPVEVQFLPFDFRDRSSLPDSQTRPFKVFSPKRLEHVPVVIWGIPSWRQTFPRDAN